MDIGFTAYSGSVLLSYCGLFVGLLLCYFSKEELYKGKPYITFFQNILLLVIGSLLLFKLTPFLLLNIILLILFLILFTRRYFFIKSFKKEIVSSTLVYITLGVFVFFTTRSIELFYIILILMFIYGLCVTSKLFKNKSLLKNSIIHHFLFVIISILVYIIFNWIN